jgi:subtilisin family serine protease
MGHRTAARLLALGCAALTGGVAGQINLPPLRLPALPPAGLASPLGAAAAGAANSDSNALTSLRRTTVQNLIRRNPQLIEADPNGEAMLRGQLLALDLNAPALERIAAAGFTVLSQQRLAGIDSTLYVLQAAPRLSTRRALRELRALEADAVFDYDHIYGGSATATGTYAPMAEAGSPPLAATQSVEAPHGDGEQDNRTRVGLIDGGVQSTHAVFHEGSIVLWGCDGRPVPSAHGTAVASLLIGDAGPFRGAAPGARLYAADVYCGRPDGGAVDLIAAALAWLDADQVAVINISLVGPDNTVLRQVVNRMIARGHIIVAAVGNDGPAAPPLYPAAYPDVVGVTAVDAHRRVLLEAERGAQVAFAAPGADMAAASYPEGYSNVRGTSFAAPLVAGLLALRLPEPERNAARAAIASLAHEAIHLGGTGRDSTFGLGLVAEQQRVPPDIMQARPAPLP